MSVTALKQELGLMGRADFLSPGIFGCDIAYPDERVAMWVDSCVWSGCDKHGWTFTSDWQARVDRWRNDADVATKNLQAIGWRVLRDRECRVTKNPHQVAAWIMQQLAMQPDIEGDMDELQLAKLARVDALSRCELEDWREFLKTVKRLGKLWRREAEEMLPEMSPEVFGVLWRCANHHGIIGYGKDGYRDGGLLNAALVDAGLGGDDETV